MRLATLFNAVNVLIHTVCALALHLVGNMAVDIQRKRRCGVSQIALYRLDVIPGPDGGNGVGMPLLCHKGTPVQRF